MSNNVVVRFYSELNDFIPIEMRHQPSSQPLKESCSVKHFIESSGVPHTEIALILVDGIPVDFDYTLHRNERLSVYPHFTSLDVSDINRICPLSPADIRFTLDVHLGKLASYLRLLGFDSHYRNNASDSELAADSSKEQRILLTRDRLLLKRSEISYGYCVRSSDPEWQLSEVVQRYSLLPLIKPYTRCLKCNGILNEISKNEVPLRIPKYVRDTYEDLHLCEGCGRIYWPGTHYSRMNAFIHKIMD